MKDDSWGECLENSDVIEVSPDKQKAKSLIETAEARIRFLKGIRIDKENARFIFEGYYVCAAEVLHSLLLLKGFKSENHVCLGFYLRDVMKRADLFNVFDDCRYKRNSIVYYGKKIDFEVLKDRISKIIMFIEEVLLMISKLLG